MTTIGVVTKSEKAGNFFKDFFGRYRCRILPVEEYGIRFAAVSDKSNYRRIFHKLKVEYAVVLTDKPVAETGFKIIDGSETYKKMLPQTVRKVIKGNCVSRVAIVDKQISADCVRLADKLCRVCSCLVFVTTCTEKAEGLCDVLMEKYGAPAEVAKNTSDVVCDVAVVLEHCPCRFQKGTTVFDMTSTDFYIPFKVKPPFGMSNLTFADCIAKSIDNS